MRKPTADESLCIRGTNKYSGEGEEMAPISLVITPLVLAIWPLAIESKWMKL